jgi:hypothetical protein
MKSGLSATGRHVADDTHWYDYKPSAHCRQGRDSIPIPIAIGTGQVVAIKKQIRNVKNYAVKAKTLDC